MVSTEEKKEKEVDLAEVVVREILGPIPKEVARKIAFILLCETKWKGHKQRTWKK